MQQHECNERDCPLRDQTGYEAVKDFDRIVAQLPPEQYAAFQAERAKCQTELDQYVAVYGYRT